ncbi:MAG: fused MFS/spermidine synthase [Desulfarculus sp.]|nr:fused MFS/spermidine synthase [Desulfarculus sp.]
MANLAAATLPAPAPALSAARSRLLVGLFTLTILVSAGLLFWCELLFGKMVLPLAGGTPAVWTTCLVFFQLALLAGYLYAFLVTRYLSPRAQVLAQLSLLALSLTTLPLAVARQWLPPAEANPIPWLLMLLTFSLGPSFFMLSTNAPLLQAWFARSGHPARHDPYFLYAGSNLGSMAALLGFPVLIEPLLTLKEQAWSWSLGYGLLALLLASCAWASLRWRQPGGSASIPLATAGPAPAAALSWRLRLRWLMLSLVPSSLLMAVTTHLSTDVAAMPLLWVIPLALYLLSFILVFARRPPIPQGAMTRVLPLLLLPLVMLLAGPALVAWYVSMPLELLVLFVACMVCHGQLAASRPAAGRLTEFYFWISLGGALGGLFNAIAAPLLFNWVAEYPIALVLVGMMFPVARGQAAGRWAPWLDWLLPALLLALLLAGRWGLSLAANPALGFYGVLGLSGLAIVWCLSCQTRPLRFGLGLGAVLLSGFLAGQADVLQAQRSFFSVLKVRHDTARNFHVLGHGNIVHGFQAWAPAERRRPLAYYHPEGPVGQIMGSLRRSGGSQVGVIGLGAGGLSAYAQPGDQWTYYEIDPLVRDIALNPAFFTFLGDAPAPTRVVLGDARLTLAQDGQGRYDLFILDAFNSDAIPVHLVTLEALGLYLERLAPGGLLALHVTNRYLNLEGMLGRLAQESGLAGLIRRDKVLDHEAGRNPSVWVALARHPADLEHLSRQPGWRPLRPDTNARPWSDDYSNVLRYMKWLSPEQKPDTPS